MAFNGVMPSEGPFVLESGDAVRVWVSRNGGEDFGAQWIQAHPIGPGFLQVTDFAKEHRIEIPNRLITVYWATVTNIGSAFSIFSLSGGGNI
jgi:hypothetical protein